MRIKIAYSIPFFYNSGGMERILSVKANYLADHDYEVHIIITDGGDKPPAFPLNDSIQIHQLGINFEEVYQYSFMRRLWIYQGKMRKYKKCLDACLHQIKPDITIAMTHRDSGVISKMTDGSKKIGEIHFNRSLYQGLIAPKKPAFLYSFMQKIWTCLLIRKLRRLEKFVVLTYEDAASWVELDNVVVIPNPTSFFPKTYSDCTQKQVIAAGRYVVEKGFERLIAAWKQVSEIHPDWCLKIYGDGYLRPQLEKQVSEAGISETCLLEHATTNIEEKFCNSSIFAFSSRSEGFGLVIVEAMSCGLPVVSYACPCGPRDIISDGVDGFLVEDGDIDGLAQGINKLIENQTLRQTMGKNARQKSLSYSLDAVGKKWEELFHSLIDKN